MWYANLHMRSKLVCFFPVESRSSQKTMERHVHVYDRDYKRIEHLTPQSVSGLQSQSRDWTHQESLVLNCGVTQVYTVPSRTHHSQGCYTVVNCSNSSNLCSHSVRLQITIMGIYSQVLYVRTSEEACECFDTCIDIRYD